MKKEYEKRVIANQSADWCGNLLILVFNKMLKEHFIKPQGLWLAAKPQKNVVNTFLIADKRCAAKAAQ